MQRVLWEPDNTVAGWLGNNEMNVMNMGERSLRFRFKFFCNCFCCLIASLFTLVWLDTLLLSYNNTDYCCFKWLTICCLFVGNRIPATYNLNTFWWLKKDGDNQRSRDRYPNIGSLIQYIWHVPETIFPIMQMFSIYHQYPCSLFSDHFF